MKEGERHNRKRCKLVQLKRVGTGEHRCKALEESIIIRSTANRTTAF